MIVRQLSPWSSGWNTPGNALARMRRDMETLMERLTGESADVTQGGCGRLREARSAGSAHPPSRDAWQKSLRTSASTS